MSAPCTLCPRKCGADRTVRLGFCGAGDTIRVARAMPHNWEEPCISGKRGSGAIFFSGCTLKCVYCQNAPISHGRFGADISDERFREICFELKAKGVHNINLVTPDPYLERVAPILREIKSALALPIVINCGGYLSERQLALLEGVADVYLPDFKYADSELARTLSAAEDYPEVAERAIAEMVRQVGRPTFDEAGMLVRGVLVRHLVLPGCRKNSLAVLDRLAERFGRDELMVSLMAQYTPPADGTLDGRLNRRLTSFEYRSVADSLAELGFEGFMQERDSAKESYTPSFRLEGVEMRGQRTVDSGQ